MTKGRLTRHAGYTWQAPLTYHTFATSAFCLPILQTCMGGRGGPGCICGMKPAGTACINMGRAGTET